MFIVYRNLNKKEKMSSKIIFLILATHILFNNVARGQGDEERINVGVTIPEVAIMDIEYQTNSSLEFEVLPSAEAGSEPVVQQTNSEKLWINYSSATTTTGSNRSIVAQITDGTLPEGISLYVEASPYSGTGKGETGVSAGKTLIGNAPRPIITSIGSCYTGDGINNGHSLNFSLDINNMEKVTAMEPSEFTILYTITDN